MSSGLTRRRGAGGTGLNSAEGENSNTPSRTNSTTNHARDSAPETSYENGENGHKIAFDPRDISESAERSKQPKLTMMEEVLLLGLKDKQVSETRLPAYYWLIGTNLGRVTSPSGMTTSHTPFAVAS